MSTPCPLWIPNMSITIKVRPGAKTFDIRRRRLGEPWRSIRPAPEDGGRRRVCSSKRQARMCLRGPSFVLPLAGSVIFFVRACTTFDLVGAEKLPPGSAKRQEGGWSSFSLYLFIVMIREHVWAFSSAPQITVNIKDQDRRQTIRTKNPVKI